MHFLRHTAQSLFFFPLVFNNFISLGSYNIHVSYEGVLKFKYPTTAVKSLRTVIKNKTKQSVKQKILFLNISGCTSSFFLLYVYVLSTL